MNPANFTSRREFLKTSGSAIAGAALAGTLATPRAGYCAEDNAIKVALVGCGGRGTGAAANALSTKGPVKLWAMADVFEHRLEGSHKSLSAKHTSQMFVPPERRFGTQLSFEQPLLFEKLRLRTRVVRRGRGESSEARQHQGEHGGL